MAGCEWATRLRVKPGRISCEYTSRKKSNDTVRGTLIEIGMERNRERKVSKSTHTYTSLELSEGDIDRPLLSVDDDDVVVFIAMAVAMYFQCSSGWAGHSSADYL